MKTDSFLFTAYKLKFSFVRNRRKLMAGSGTRGPGNIRGAGTMTISLVQWHLNHRNLRVTVFKNNRKHGRITLNSAENSRAQMKKKIGSITTYFYRVPLK